jgi:signal transduction histidine kinase/CheY-like chemotaxis protein
MLRKFRIKTRLLISFFIIVLFTLIIGLTGYASLISFGNTAVRTIKNVSILNDLYDKNVAIDAGLFNMLYISDINLIDYVIETTREYSMEFLFHLNEYLKYQDQFSDVFTPGEMQIMENLLEIYEETYISVVNEIFRLMEHRNRGEALSIYINRFVPIFDAFVYYINDSFAKNLEYSMAETERSHVYALFNAYLMLALVLISLVVSILLSFAVTKSIAVPLSELGLAAEKVAHGELDVQFEKVESNDEIAYLSQRLDETLQQLNQAQQLKLDAVKVQYEKEKAQAASKSKDVFLARMSHEIRTPMNAIIGMAELLMREDLSFKARSYVHDIKQAGGNLISIINDILDISKIEAGKMEIVPAKYLLSSLINDTVNIIRMRLAEKPIKFKTYFEDNIPNGLIGDVVRMRQVLLNLLSNAVKYTKSGHISLSLSVDKKSLIHVWLKAEISDTGKGIKLEDQEKLFGEFIRLDSQHNQGIEGTGLGLSIAKRLCYAMGGDITVKSEYGKGSTFTVIIPQFIESEEPFSLADDSQKEMDKAFSISFSIPQGRLLIVDDIPTNLKVADGLLAPYNTTIDTCTSGREAIELVKYNNYDVVFMDHMMPEMDGIEAVSHIRAFENSTSREEVPIIALTANVVVGMREMFLEKGFNDFLAKPIDVSKLDEILDKWMPEEKKQKTTVNDDQLPMNNEHNLQEKNLSIAGIDIEKGIKMTGGTLTNYRQVLSLFHNDAKDRLPVLQTLPSAETLSLFTTQVHALKSAAASIGAQELSNKAAALEAAGRNGNMAAIENNLSKFSSDLEELIGNINKALVSYNDAVTQESGDNTSALSGALLQKLNEALVSKEAASDIFGILNDVNKLPQDQKTRELIEKVSYHVLMTEYDEAAKITAGLLEKN